MRYGFKRTTMGDIAQAAGLSRPGLYLVFSSKEDIFAGVIERFSTSAIDDIKQHLPQLTTLKDKLNYVFEVAFARPFETALQSPHAEELFESGQSIACSAIDDSYTNLRALVTSILKSEPVELKPLKLTPAKLAHILTTAARGLKHQSRDAKDLRHSLSGLVQLTVAATQPAVE